MANEFIEFLILIGRLILLIFIWTINLICLGLILISCAVIWRTISVIHAVSDCSSMSDFREVAVIQIALVVCDLFTIPVGLMSLAMPTRIYHFFALYSKAFTEEHSSSRKANYNWELRFFMWCNFGYAILDFFSFPFGLLSLISPTRFVAFFRIIGMNWDKYLEDKYSDMRLEWIWNCGLAFFDLFVIPQAIIALLIPTRLYHVIKGLTQAYEKGEVIDNNARLNYNTEYRRVFISSCWTGCLDMLVLFCGILGVVIMPTRFWAFCRSIYVHWDYYKKDEYGLLRIALVMNLVCALIEWVTILHVLFLPLMWTRYYHIFDQIKKIHNEDDKKKYGNFHNDVKYNFLMRQMLMLNLYPGLYDWSAILFAVLACLLCPFTRVIPFVRSFSAFKERYKQDAYNGWRISCFISVPMAIIDFVTIIFGTLAILSLIRAIPLIQDLTKYSRNTDVWGNFESEPNWRLRLVVFYHCAFVFIDIIFVPMFLVCLCSVYRGVEVMALIIDTEEWTETRMNQIRLSILFNFFNLLVDLLVFSWMLIIVAASLYRFIPWLGRVRHSWHVYFYNRKIEKARTRARVGKESLQTTQPKEEHVELQDQMKLEESLPAQEPIEVQEIKVQDPVVVVSESVKVQEPAQVQDSTQIQDSAKVQDSVETQKLAQSQEAASDQKTPIQEETKEEQKQEKPEEEQKNLEEKQDRLEENQEKLEEKPEKKIQNNEEPTTDPETVDDEQANRNETVTTLSQDSPSELLKEPIISLRTHLFINLCLVFVDIMLTIPAIAIILCTLYRIKILVGIWLDKNDEDIIVGVNVTDYKPVGQYANQFSDEMEQYYQYVHRHRIKTYAQALFVILDIPCLILSILIYLTIWRASTLHKLLEHYDASSRRWAALTQFLLLLRDMIFVIPFLIIVCTLFRLPMLILGFMGKLRKPRLTNAQLELTSCAINLPVNGKPVFHIKAKKPNGFQLSKNSNCSLFVLGERFWEEVGQKFGGSVATAGQGFLPNTIGHEKGMNYDLINTVEHGNNIEFDVEVQVPTTIARTTIQTNLARMAKNVSLCLQLEHNETGVLFILILTIQDILDAAARENGIKNLNDQHYGANERQINDVRGVEYSGIVDCFYILVGLEFIKWCIDILHIILFLALAIIPWRWIQCWIILLEHPTKWNARIDAQCVGMMEHAHSIFLRVYDFLFEPTVNDLVKEEATNEIRIKKRLYKADRAYVIDKWCRYMKDGFYEFEQELMAETASEMIGEIDNSLIMELNIDTYDVVVKSTTELLNSIKPDPPATAKLIHDFFQMHMILFWLKCLRIRSNMLLIEDRVGWEQNAVLQEQIHLKELHFRKRLDYFRTVVHESHQELEKKAKESAKASKCSLLEKPLDLIYQQIREYAAKGLADILTIVLLALLIITMYRFIPLCRDIYRLIRVTSKKSQYKKSVARSATASTNQKDKKEEKKEEEKNEEKKEQNTENENKNENEDENEEEDENNDDDDDDKSEMVEIPPPSLRFGLKTILKQQLLGLVEDMWLFVQFVLWSTLIAVTVVRLFEFIAELVDGGRKHGRTRMSLRMAVEIAREQATRKICKNLYQIFTLFVAWKTYKFAVASLIFGTFLPAAGFLELFKTICPGCPRKLRQMMAISLWLGGIITLMILVFNGTIPKNGIWSSHSATDRTQELLYGSCFTVLAICITSALILLCFKSHDNEALFERPSRKDYAPRSLILPRQCPTCLARLRYGALEEPWRYFYTCNNCSKYVDWNKRYYCPNECGGYWGSIYCVSCIESLPVDSTYQQIRTAPGTLPDTSVILWSFPKTDYIGYSVRATWPNALAIFGMIIEVGVMIALAFSLFFMQNKFSWLSNLQVPTDDVFHTLTKLSRYVLLANMGSEAKGYDAISIIFMIAALFWVIVVSLPLVCEELFNWTSKKGTFSQSPMWIKFAWFYNRSMYLYFIVQWIQMFQCVYVPSGNGEYNGYVLRYDVDQGSGYCFNKSWKGYGYTVWSFFFMLFFWLTSSIVMIYHDGETRHLRMDNLDIRYPIAFSVFLQLLQSLFVVTAMLYSIVSIEQALSWCLAFCILMWIWHLIYPLITWAITSPSNENLIYECTSIPYIVAFRITLYTIFLYVMIILYGYSKNSNVWNTQQIGLLIIYGASGILILGFLVAILVRWISVKHLIERIRESDLKPVLTALMNLFEETSSKGAMGHWYQSVGKKKIQRFMDEKNYAIELASPSSLAYLLVEFERHIIHERLSAEFLKKRRDWLGDVLDCERFEDTIIHIQTLSAGIRAPPFYTMAVRILSEESMFRDAPMDLCFLVMEFVVDVGNIKDLFTDTVLHDSKMPNFNPTNFNILTQIASYEELAISSIEEFITPFEEMERQRKQKWENEQKKKKEQEHRRGSLPGAVPIQKRQQTDSNVFVEFGELDAWENPKNEKPIKPKKTTKAKSASLDNNNWDNVFEDNKNTNEGEAWVEFEAKPDGWVAFDQNNDNNNNNNDPPVGNKSTGENANEDSLFKSHELDI